MSRPALPQSFLNQKADILAKLSVPLEQYTDRSPKGSVDIGIRELIDEINEFAGCVTTSSCAGRVSVFLEGKRGGSASLEDGEEEGDGEVRESTAGKSASIGGKGAGGKWLYVSHDPLAVDILESRESSKTLHGLLGMKRDPVSDFQLRSGDKPGDVRWVRFKFEPMVSHVMSYDIKENLE
jgi:tRNA wybutosine-synthesizing protein 3